MVRDGLLEPRMPSSAKNLTSDPASRSGQRPVVSEATILERVRNAVRKKGIFKYQIGHVIWYDGIDSDGDPAFFFRIGVRPRHGEDEIPIEDLREIVATTHAVMKRAKLVGPNTYFQIDDVEVEDDP